MAVQSAGMLCRCGSLSLQAVELIQLPYFCSCVQAGYAVIFLSRHGSAQPFVSGVHRGLPLPLLLLPLLVAGVPASRLAAASTSLRLKTPLALPHLTCRLPGGAGGADADRPV